MPEILINVINKIPVLSGDVRQITADNSDYTIRFVFDDDWTDGPKTVYFVRQNGFAFPTGRTDEDKAAIPVVRGVQVRDWLYIGVQQGDVKTSRPCGIPVYKSITDMIADDAVQPDPTMWEGVLLQITENERRIQEIIDGYAKLSDIPAPDIFWVTYGKTKFAEVADAVAAGQLCVLNRFGRMYPMLNAYSYADTSWFDFGGLQYSSTIDMYRLKSGDKWAEWSYTAVYTNDLKNSIGETSTHSDVPSAKAVWDAILANAGSGSGVDVTADAGQTIRVTEVDDNGKPTAWEAADYQPRTHWSEAVDETNLLYQLAVGFTDGAAALTVPLTGIKAGETYRVSWNGVDYTCVAIDVEIGDDLYGVVLGDLGAREDGVPTTGEPFVIAVSPVQIEGVWGEIYALDGSSTALVEISEIITEKIHPLPNKYLDLHWIPSAEEVEFVKDLYVPESPYKAGDYPELFEYVASIADGCEIAVTVDGMRKITTLSGSYGDGYYTYVMPLGITISSIGLTITSLDGDVHTISISGFRYPSIPAGMVRGCALPQPDEQNYAGNLVMMDTVIDGKVVETRGLPLRKGEYTDGTMSDSAASVEFVQSGVELARKEAADKSKELSTAIGDLKTRVDAMQEPAPRYGVSGVGGSATALTRIWDAAGLTAMVGTDKPGVYYNDFDSLAPFNRRKCVGVWSAPDESGKAHFTVNAYYGDPDYAEDGTMGDYVAVEVEPFWFYQNLDDGVIGVSAGKQAGWSVHPVCIDEGGNVREKTYLPCYALAVNEAGDAVSLPGYHTAWSHYQGLRNTCRTYGGGNNAAHLEPMAVRHYEWLLFTIEFATTNCQSVMMGAASMPYSADDKVALDGTDVNYVVVTAAIGNKFVVGQTIYIGTTYSTSASADNLNIVAAIEPCDADGTPNESGTYRRITYSGRTNTVTAGTTTISSRPWITGSCNDVATPSGSPVSNTSGKYPMRYRYRENIWANCYSTCNDLFDVLAGAGTDDDPYHIIWHYLIDPDWFPASSGGPNASDFAGESFVQLDQITEHVNGYIKKIEADPNHPECIVPVVQTGGGSTTYFADYAYFVNGTVVIRSVRCGGTVTNGSPSGVLCFGAYSPVSTSSWHYGGGLYFRQ